jgi:hypothetical protein
MLFEECARLRSRLITKYGGVRLEKLLILERKSITEV